MASFTIKLRASGEWVRLADPEVFSYDERERILDCLRGGHTTPESVAELLASCIDSWSFGSVPETELGIRDRLGALPAVVFDELAIELRAVLGDYREQLLPGAALAARAEVSRRLRQSELVLKCAESLARDPDRLPAEYRWIESDMDKSNVASLAKGLRRERGRE